MRFLQRALALILLVALGVWLFYVGREHQVLLDNKTIELEGRTFKALQEVRVSVNGAEPVELYPRDRDMVKVVGPAFSLRVEIEDPGSDVELVEREVRVGFGKDLMLSFPLMAASRDFILPPPALQQAPAPEAVASEDAPVPGAGEEVPAVPTNP